MSALRRGLRVDDLLYLIRVAVRSRAARLRVRLWVRIASRGPLGPLRPSLRLLCGELPAALL